jgi:LysM repeat protein
MNSTDNPLVPQGSFLDQKNRGRARVKIAVFVVLAIHGIGLLALLMQGCKPNAGDPAAEADAPTNAIPEFMAEAPIIETNSVPDLSEAYSNLAPVRPEVFPEPITPVSPIRQSQSATVEPQIIPPPGVTGATEHKIAKGDTFSVLAKRYNVSVRALQAANPTVDPTRLKIDSTIRIPPPEPSAGTTARATAPEVASNGTTYKVQSGDTLSRIASRFGTSVKAIRRENNLKTERILVGQTLKIPVKESTSPTGTAALRN